MVLLRDTDTFSSDRANQQAKFSEMTDQIKPSDQFDASSTFGPQVDEIQFNTIMKYIEIGKTEGKLIKGGDKAADKGYCGLFWLVRSLSVF